MNDLATILLCCLVWALMGVLAGWTLRGVVERRRATESPDMAELHSSSKIWYPVGGEWRIGYRGAPTDSSMRYYLASDYQTFKEVRVAASDFREYEDGKPLLELAPPLSVVEFEREMETDR